MDDIKSRQKFGKNYNDRVTINWVYLRIENYDAQTRVVKRFTIQSF